jgi:DNA-binding CsgD family transcriptional regulator
MPSEAEVAVTERRVRRGGTYALVGELPLPQHWKLTASESRVVRLLAGGAATRDIAEILGISIHTVRTHRKRSMAKAGAHTQTELVSRVFTSRR